MQTFLNLDSSDEEIILSSENDLVIQSLKKRVKYLIIYGPRKSGKTSIANNFSKVFETNLINNLTNANLDNLPTTGLAFIEFNCRHWKDICADNSTIIDIKFPKQLK